MKRVLAVKPFDKESQRIGIGETTELPESTALFLEKAGIVSILTDVAPEVPISTAVAVEEIVEDGSIEPGCEPLHYEEQAEDVNVEEDTPTPTFGASIGKRNNTSRRN